MSHISKQIDKINPKHLTFCMTFLFLIALAGIWLAGCPSSTYLLTLFSKGTKNNLTLLVQSHVCRWWSKGNMHPQEAPSWMWIWREWREWKEGGAGGRICVPSRFVRLWQLLTSVSKKVITKWGLTYFDL